MDEKKFYFDFKDAVAHRQTIITKVVGRQWKPFNIEVEEVLIKPNKKTTYGLEVKFSNGKHISFYEFLEANNLDISFCDNK